MWHSTLANLASRSSVERAPRRLRFYDTSGSRQELGRPLSVEQALKFVQESQTCNIEGHSEASWKCEVHLPLLKRSLELSAHASIVAAKLLYVSPDDWKAELTNAPVQLLPYNHRHFVRMSKPGYLPLARSILAWC